MSFSDRLRANPAALPVVTAIVLYGFWVFRGHPFAGYDDVYTHAFLAQHFLRSWFEPWNLQWYGGFDQSSYPPLAHQTMAIFAALFGLQRGCQIVQWLIVPWLVVGIYRFSRIWVEPKPAAFAAMAGALAASILQATVLWGQIPSVFAVGFLVNATRDLDLWLRGDLFRRGFFATAGFLVVAASHHITVFGSALFLLPAIAESFRRSDLTPAETWARFLSFAVLIIGAGLAVSAPFLTYVIGHPVEQVTIPHFSRQSAFHGLQALRALMLTPLGALAAFMPYVAWNARNRILRPLVLSWMVATVFGLSDTTPLPRLILGPLFNILTLDRFMFWASLLMLPVVGLGIDALPRRWLKMAVLAVMAAFHLTYAETQVKKALMRIPPVTPAIIGFLNEAPHDSYRYLTLSLGGASLAWIAAHTNAQSIDGNYHVARPIPELRGSGLASLDLANPRALKVVSGFLFSPQKYHLRYVFCRNPVYVPELEASGWTRLAIPGVDGLAWEAPRTIEPLAPADWKGPDRSRIIRGIWGLCPLLLVAYGMLAAAQNWKKDGDGTDAG